MRERERVRTENTVGVVIESEQVRILYCTAHLPLLDVRVKPEPDLVLALID